jgi:hypothetical protein
LKYPRLTFSLLLSIFATSLLWGQTLPLSSFGNLPASLNETSGLATNGPGSIWTHNDSGGANKLYEVDTLGNILRTLTITNASNVDWEELAQDDQGNLYIGDFGNNGNSRTNLKVYKIPDPSTLTGDSVLADVISFSYADQTAFPPSASQLHYDMEAMIWYQGSLHLFSKNRTNPFNGFTRLYALPDTAGTYAISPIDSFYTGPGPKELYWITAADISPAGQQLILLSYGKLWLFSCFNGTDFFGGGVQQLNFGPFTQYEGVTFISETEIYLSNETNAGVNASLHQADLSPFLALPNVNLGPDIIATGSSVQLSAGNTIGLSVLWNTGDTTNTITVDTAGTYIVNVSIGNCSDADTIVVSFACDNFSSSLSATQPACAGASSGAINLSLTAGTAPFFYSWSNGATTQNLTGVPAGVYTVMVTDINNCQLFDTIAMAEPTPLMVQASTNSNPVCFGSSNGFIDITASGGTPPYAYSWSNGSTSPDLSNVVAGNYTLFLSDSNQCTEQFGFSLGESPEILITSQVSDARCFGEASGGIDISVSGGIPPYGYDWSNGMQTEDLDSIAAGPYFLMVTDSIGCTQSLTEQVGQGLPIGIALSSVDASCPGESSGSVELMVAGGTPPYHFSWSNGDTTEDLLAVSADTYVVTIADSNGCERIDSIAVDEPPAPDYSLFPNDLFCYGDSSGNIQLSLSGGIGPFQYHWSSGDTTQSLSNLAAGTYFLQLTDGLACQYEDTVVLQQPDSFSLVFTTIPDTMGGPGDGTATVAVSGGTPPYVYSWSTGASDSTITGLRTGTYELWLSDANGCGIQAEVEVEEIVLESIAQLPHILRYQLSPNPSNGILYLRLEWERPEAVELMLWNLQGQKLWRERHPVSTQHEIQLDLAPQAPGIYLLEVRTASGRQVERVVRE